MDEEKKPCPHQWEYCGEVHGISGRVYGDLRCALCGKHKFSGLESRPKVKEPAQKNRAENTLERQKKKMGG